MTQVTYTTQIGNGPVFLEYWNGVEFTSIPATVAQFNPVTMWSWLEENAPFIAMNPKSRNLKVETIG